MIERHRPQSSETEFIKYGGCVLQKHTMCSDHCGKNHLSSSQTCEIGEMQ